MKGKNQLPRNEINVRLYWPKDLGQCLFYFFHEDSFEPLLTVNNSYKEFGHLW